MDQVEETQVGQDIGLAEDYYSHCSVRLSQGPYADEEAKLQAAIYHMLKANHILLRAIERNTREPGS